MPRGLAAMRYIKRAAGAASIALWMVACSKNPPAPPAAVAVSTVTIVPHPVTFTEDYVGADRSHQCGRDPAAGRRHARIARTDRGRAGQVRAVAVRHRSPTLYRGARAGQSRLGAERGRPGAVAARSGAREVVVGDRRRQPAGTGRGDGEEPGQRCLDRRRTGGGEDRAAESRLYHHHQPDRRRDGPRAIAAGAEWSPQTARC